MVNIREISDNELAARLHAHEEIGGVLRISVFEISKNYEGYFPNEYDAHLITARQTLEKQNFELNFHFNKVAAKNKRAAMAYAQTDFEKLDPSGEKIDLYHFLGPRFDLENRKPLVRGRTGNHLNSYFYYDQEEIPSNIINTNQLESAYRGLYPNSKGYFMDALMEPPYRMRVGTNILEHGKYLLEFIEYFFCDINLLTIYAWDTNCSIVFDAGKEWWGSYFWTIYNPTKNWYIGIIASETD